MFVVLSKKNLCITSFVICVCIALCGVIAFAKKANPKEEKEGIRLPVIMYHSVLKDSSKSGKYVVTPAEMESDFKYIKDHGYTSVLSADLINYVRGGSIAQKPIMITLDDGYLNNLTYVLPLLEKYDLKAVISVVGSYTERFSKEEDHNPNYSHFNYDDIKTLIDSGRVEIGNHTYDLHKLGQRSGCCIRRGEDKQSYKNMLYEDLNKAQNLLKEHLNYTPVVFTYPYGSSCETSKEVVKSLGFKVSLGCAQKVNFITRNEDDLYMLARFNRESGAGTENFMSRLEK